jgi:hypothetical protein
VVKFADAKIDGMAGMGPMGPMGPGGMDHMAMAMGKRPFGNEVVGNGASSNKKQYGGGGMPPGNYNAYGMQGFDMSAMVRGRR